MMRLTQLGLCWALAIGWPVTAAAFQARISRPVVQETLAAGGVATGRIEIENQGESPLSLAVYLEDWEYLEGGSGDKRFSPPGSSPWSASSWISFYPQRLELSGREKGAVDYTIRVPADASGGRYAVLFFESLLTRSQPDQTGVTVQYTGRLGVLFEVEVAGSVERAGEVTGLKIGRPDEDRPLALSYSFSNTGNVAARPKAFFNITDETGRYFGRGEFNQLYTFPGRSGSAKTEWTGNLPPGDYTVLLTVDLGENQALVSEQPLSVKRELVIEGVGLRGGEPAQAVVTVHNAGHVQTECEGTLTIETGAGSQLGAWPISKVVLAPDERQPIRVSGSLAATPGHYQCRVRLAYSGLSVEQTLPCQMK